MNKIKKFIQKIKKNNNNDSNNDNDNNINNIYVELNNINFESKDELNYTRKYEYNLDYKTQKKILEQEKMINHNIWINKMEAEKNVCNDDYKIMSKILLLEAYTFNKQYILQHADDYKFIFKNNDSIQIRNILNNCCLFRKNNTFNENIET